LLAVTHLLGTLDSVASLLAVTHLLGTLGSVASLLAVTHLLGILDSVASLLAATHFQENLFNGEIHNSYAGVAEYKWKIHNGNLEIISFVVRFRSYPVITVNI
jgi:hypothetical protein